MKCPSCKKEISKTTDQQWLPFCCERCKLVDFGAWINEEHAIPGEEVIVFPDDDIPQH